MEFRVVNAKPDLEQLKLLWKDAAWDAELEDYEAALRHLIPHTHSLVADDDRGIAAVVASMGGEFQFLESSLPMSVVLSVLSAAHARRQGHSAELLTILLQQEQTRGAVVAVLGAFDQGYYDKLGFGTGGYDPVMVMNPAALRIPSHARRALDHPSVRIRRITNADSEALFASWVRHKRYHGACTAKNVGFVSAMMHGMAGQGFGLAICEGSGTNEHIAAHFFGKRLGEGKLDILWACADTPARYLQLLEVIHRLSDQLEQVKLTPPPYIALHDLLARPLRDGIVHTGHPFDDALLWQLRILDIPRAIHAVRLPIAETVHFTLRITDPVEKYAPADWTGCAGDYAVQLGEESRCVPLKSQGESWGNAQQGEWGETREGAWSESRGNTQGGARGNTQDNAQDNAQEAQGEAVLDASIGAFSRFWSGALRPSALSHSDHFHASEELIAQLERVYSVPTPFRMWEF